MLNLRTPLRAGWVVLIVAGLLHAQGPLPVHPAVEFPLTSEPGFANVTPHAAEPELKDLTPPGFADLIPHDEHGEHAHTPGHLAPLVPDGHGFFATAEYLLLWPRVGGTDYAIGNRDFGLATAGPVVEHRMRLGNGVRTELGYHFAPAALDLSMGFTGLWASGDSTIGAAPGQVLFPTQTRPGLIDAVTSAVAESKLDVNAYDVLVGRRWAIDEHLAIRGFGGVRIADVFQSFDVSYNGLDARSADVLNRSRFTGAGPIAGAEAVFAWPHGFHLYARGTGGLLSGLDEATRCESNDAGRTLYADTPYSIRKVVPVVSVGLGGGFQYRNFSLRAGYEVTHWFGIYDRLRFTSDVSQGAVVPRTGNLSLDGLFVQCGVTF